MKKLMVLLTIVGAAMSGFGLSLNCQRMWTVNNRPSKQGEFKQCKSRHYYNIKINGATKQEAEHTYTIRVLPILKFCKAGAAFPYFPGVVEINGIKLDPKKGYSCTYVSPTTLWTKDTWRHSDGSLVLGDWSKGIINSSVVIELVRDSDGKIVRSFTNTTISVFTSTKTIDKGKDKLKDSYKTWLLDKVNDTVKDDYLVESAKIEDDSLWGKVVKR